MYPEILNARRKLHSKRHFEPFSSENPGEGMSVIVTHEICEDVVLRMRLVDGGYLRLSPFQKYSLIFITITGEEI